MIGWEDIYKVVNAVVPLYVALILGYASVKWWRIFTAEQCNAVNRFVCYFTFPLFTFEFTAHVNPFKMNYRFVAADIIAKLIIVAVLAFWARYTAKGKYGWSITSFSLSTLTNALVVGVPFVKAMYGEAAVELVVQASVVQAILWLTALLFVLEIRRTRNDFYSNDDGGGRVIPAESDGNDLEGNTKVVENAKNITNNSNSTCRLMRAVSLKLVMNPNLYGCVIGIAWAFISNKWHIEMPSMVEGSILILSKAGTGTAMFSMGLFMALQEKLISCGASLTILGMVLKFIAGPAAMAIACIAMGLHGDVLRVAIIQAAVPQSITSFIFAKEYGLHPEVLSTAVIFGMLVSLPILVGYYVFLAYLH
ncbi:PREDICTED: auxin efflux carrier component 5-like [Ipomoea nil]|uniref:auxin efflux carrier component 5-like n=1 Tax=Ipomoea nil TaxID=35883 RepID=UPI0009012574|nr:PREDICTED: auxin efflux carrier component 5-like [Ipomoea nil]